MRRILLVLLLPLLCRNAEPGWSTAAEARPPMTREETVAFMKKLAQFVLDHHMKKDAASAQKGLIYEYWWVKRNLWIQGEALDTMHDGAWFAAAMVNAFRASGDTFYRDVLTQWQLPFYLKMLNHSDELFNADRNDAQPDKQKTWSEAREWLLQGREKGFVPYWWDDGASTNMERLQSGKDLSFYPCYDALKGQPNPEFKLSGWSLGSSNHLAQDLAVMLQQAWAVFKNDPALAPQIAEAAANLEQCRTRHGAAGIPAVLAAWGLSNPASDALKRIPASDWKTVLALRNHYLQAFFDFQPGKKYSMPGFADDQEYRYYFSTAKNGTLTESAAFNLVYDAYTEPMAFDRYCDDAKRPAGINIFDLYPVRVVDGKPESLRSERKGPNKRPVPLGSRMGPQNMVCCGWALQALKAYPDLWQHAKTEAAKAPKPIPHLNSDKEVTPPELKAALEHELAGGLRTWEAIFNEYGYLPTGIGTHGIMANVTRDEFSDTGAYAHLISAAAQWVIYLDGKRDWEMAK